MLTRKATARLTRKKTRPPTVALIQVGTPSTPVVLAQPTNLAVTAV